MTGTWTPQLVADAMVEASTWLNQTTRNPYAKGVGSAMPVWTPTIEDWLEEGWGLPEFEEGDEPERKLAPTPERVAMYEAALNWPALYLAGWDQDLALSVQAHIAATTRGRPFNRVAISRGLTVSSARRFRTRGLSVISVKLTTDRVPLW